MDQNIMEKALSWTKGNFDKKTQKEIQLLIDTENESELVDRFWKELDFGTGGLRGIRGAGLNRMNIYNIRKVTQGLANYILAHGGAKKGVVIGRDSRIGSLEFAQEAATVLIKNNIQVYFFKDLCPTPVLSYIIRKIEAKAGIMNTASHNPKEYNGFKVFWDDGAQLTSPHDNNIIAEIHKLDNTDKIRTGPFSSIEKSPLFQYCDKFFEDYIKEVENFIIDKNLCKSTDLKILYSPLHGCGYKILPKLFKKVGFKNLELLESQSYPDGNFPTITYPNPEDSAALALGIERSKEINADLFLATDPDADRIGVSYKSSCGSYEILNGNTIGALLLEYLAQHKKQGSSVVITTIVTSPFIKRIAEEYQLIYSEVLTGFKWIASEIENQKLLEHNFLIGLEESHGYLISDLMRDKDGISAAMLFSEMTAFYKEQGKYLDQVLMEMTLKYGYYKDSQHSLNYPGLSGMKEIEKIMNAVRYEPPKTVAGRNLSHSIDYLNNATGLPTSNVVSLLYEDNVRIIARPSGTEPKIKFYFSSVGEMACVHCMDIVEKDHAIIKETFLDIVIP